MKMSISHLGREVTGSYDSHLHELEKDEHGSCNGYGRLWTVMVASQGRMFCYASWKTAVYN